MNPLALILNAGAVAGITVGMLAGYGEIVDGITPTLHAAVAYQEAVVRTAEDNDMTYAPAIRAEWESAAHKPAANAGIQQLEIFAQGIRDAIAGHPEAAATNAASTLFDN